MMAAGWELSPQKDRFLPSLSVSARGSRHGHSTARHSFLFFLFFLLATATGFSQTEDYKFHYYSVEHGLPNSTVRAIHQDAKGFMWFGTMQGLCRFDGYGFQRKITDPADLVYTIFSDKTGLLWIATEKGLIRYDPNREDTRRYQNLADDKESLSFNRVLSLAEDRFDNLWIVSQRGIDIYNRPADRFFRVPIREDGKSPWGKGLKMVHPDRSGNLWFASEGGGLSVITAGHLKRFSQASDLAGIRIHHFLNDDPHGFRLHIPEVETVHEDTKGTLWIGTTNDGIYLVPKKELLQSIDNPGTSVHLQSMKAHFFQSDKLGSNQIRCFYEDTSGKIWIGTYGGGLYLYLGKENFRRFAGNENIRGSLSNDFIQSLFQDRSGILWVGTSGGGINKMIRTDFKAFRRSQTGIEDGLYESMIFSILEDRDGDLWLGTRNGLSFYHRKTEKFVHYSNNPRYLPGIRSDILRALCQDHAGNIWISTSAHGLFQHDKRRGTFINFSHQEGNPESVSNNNIRSLLPADKDHLWIGTATGLDILDLTTGKFRHFYHRPDDATSLSHDYIFYLFQDRWKNIWVCTRNGLNLFDSKTNTFSRYFPAADPARNEIATITGGKDGVMWLGTTKQGIFSLSPSSYRQNGEPVFSSSSRIQKLTQEYPLVNEFIYSMQTDGMGKIWFGTNHGLWYWDPAAGQLKQYDVQDGLQSNEFNTNASFQSSDGTMYFGGVNGFNTFHPDRLKHNPLVPNVVITSLKLYDKEILHTGTGPTANKIDLSYKDNYISIEFAVLDYSDPQNNRFAYRLEGLDKDWIFAENRRYANYANLKSGDYLFRVKGATKENVWNETGASLQIHVSPPFYQTSFFQLLAVCSAIAAVMLIVKIRTKRLDQLNKKLESLVQQRTEEIKQSEDRYRSFVSQTTEGIWRCEFLHPLPTAAYSEEQQIRLLYDTAYIAECNDAMANLFGYARAEELIDRKLNQMLFNRQYDFEHFFRRFVQSNYRLVDEKVNYTDKNGRGRTVATNLIGIVENGYLLRAWGKITDITEKLKWEEEITKTQKLESLGILAGGLAHDFNNLLTGILGNVSLAKLHLTPEDISFRRLEEAEKATLRAKDLTFQLLTFSKGGAPIKKTIDLGELLREAVDFTLSGSKSAAELQIEDNIWSVDCDEGQMIQVISNLLINASQAMLNGGTIKVTAGNVEISDDSGSAIVPPGCYVYLSVEDYGEGIRPENLTKIFDPFYTTKAKGKGLGLTSVYSIIKRHDGYIHVESQPGHGTKFHIYLPASFNPGQVTEKDNLMIQKGSGTILVMDDEEMILNLSLSLLTQLGYEVVTSRDGEEAVKKYKEKLSPETNKFQAVILDLTIPGGMGGSEAARQILQMDPEAKIFISSGYSNDPIMSDYKSYGFTDIIPKPYKITELSSTLRRALARDEAAGETTSDR